MLKVRVAKAAKIYETTKQGKGENLNGKNLNFTASRY